MSRNTTWTISRDTGLGLTFLGTWFYDGQGFMVGRDLDITSVRDLDGASICLQTGTTTELNLTDWFRAQGLAFEPVVFETLDQTKQAFFGGRCDALTTDASGLAAIRANDAVNPQDWIILPDIISKEPLGPAVRRGDEDWAALTRWVMFALIEAEELGITSTNAPDMAANSTDPRVQRLLGVTGGFGERLGVSNRFARDAIEAVGNYGEIFARTVGPDTPLGLERGLNAQWTQGGLLYAPPFR